MVRRQDGKAGSIQAYDLCEFSQALPRTRPDEDRPSPIGSHATILELTRSHTFDKDVIIHAIRHRSRVNLR